MVLRGASAEAQAGLREKLDAAAGADLSALGEDLIGAASVLRAEPGLRRLVTDQAVDASAKGGLVRQVFDGKISAGGLDLVVDAVGRRWTTTRDLADTLETLGVVAVVKSAGADSARLADELFAVTQLVNAESELRGALSDPTRSVGDKAALLGSLLEGKTLAATQRLAVLALNGSHRTVVVALDEYQKIAAAVKDESVAKVRVARDLTASDRDRLQKALTAQYGRPVHLNVSVEPDLVGGMRVEIGDDVIDGSVSSRLDDARRRLAG
ncbi:F-type H+-transporting ATPase subunit delta [Marmoricola sp. OAE513]|uniref:F0F1 ATP synthase subunit delta n=1 Tax=Marmoricola sp. OAE513 TaxID=2817894 RepID=UPI001AE5D7D2